MTLIRPFKGLRYDTGRTGASHASLCAPPYDVISPSEREELYKNSDYNVIRLILGKILPDDTAKENQYTRARGFLAEWMEKGILVRDKEENYYAYLQEYDVEGKRHRRLGFFGLFKIEDPASGTILPHEHTLAAPKKDRLELIKEVKTNLSPIFSLFSDKYGKVTEILEKTEFYEKPAVDITIKGVRHALWRISDSISVSKISAFMSDRNVFIADGHHRYEVARQYRDFARQAPGYNGNADFVMMYFTDMDAGDGLTVLATHRVINDITGAGSNDISDRMAKYFHVESHKGLECLMEHLRKKARAKHIFGFYGGGKFLSFELEQGLNIEELVDEGRTKEWKTLDVSILHSVIFRKLLGIDPKEGDVTYVRDPYEAVSLVKEGANKAAFLLNPTRVDQLRAVAEKGEMMPQKSTYFYPKLLTGLVMNKFE